MVRLQAMSESISFRMKTKDLPDPFKTRIEPFKIRRDSSTASWNSKEEILRVDSASRSRF